MSDRIDVTATIKAVDQASAAINAINRSLQGLTETAARVGAAFRRISTTGAFGGLSRNITHLGHSLGHVGHQLHGILEPMLAIAGAAGGFSLERAFEGYISTGEHLER